MAEIQCRHFSGYKPCGKSEHCQPSCPHRDLIQTRILIVHLEALGAVLRATSLLPTIRRKYPSCHITWVTAAPADQLLQGLVDRVLTTRPDDQLALRALSFDVAFCLDKSLKASGILNLTKFKMLYGFCADAETGAIVPATPAAQELWDIGLSDHKKFFENVKAETQLMAEACELNFLRDTYQVKLTSKEENLVRERRAEWSETSKVVVGINTGCSDIIPYKKLSVMKHRELIRHLHQIPNISIVLLGGPTDTERNQQIADGLDVVVSPTQLGLRDGLCSVQACDIVVTGDSLGMHMGIALKKWVVAWFGPTCQQEIDLYELGVKVLSDAACSPCWKRHCTKTPMCYDLVNVDRLVQGVLRGIEWSISSSKQLSSETSSSPSP